jgi:hypothetical protein
MSKVGKAMQAAAYGGEQLKATYQRYERFLPATAFLAGTLWDVLTLGRIDDTFNLVQLAVYLAVVAGFLALDVRELAAPLTPPAWLARWWRFREEVAHFFLGSLLSAFTIFYLKSSSLLGSLVFYLVIAACLVGNEFSALRRQGLVMRTVLFAICFASYLACVTPLLWGRIGAAPFLTAIFAAAAIGALLMVGARRLAGAEHARALVKQVATPFFGTLVLFVVFYVLRVIPPVPLALNDIGIYRSVERVAASGGVKGGGYRVTHARPWWRFWQDGEQTFAWRQGERVYVFFSVFSPGGFSERLQIRWLYDDPEAGWQASDAVPVAITGGRAEGYRGFAFKQHMRAGDWRVQVETSDGREIGRIAVDVEIDASTAPRDPAELKATVL